MVIPNPRTRRTVSRPHQTPQTLEVHPVQVGPSAVFAFGGFEDHGDAGKVRVVDEVSEAGLADLSLADVFMTIDPAAQLPLRVIHVDALDLRQADDFIQLRDHAFITCRRAKVEARGKEMTRVETDSDAGGLIQARANGSQVLKAMSDGRTLAGSGFEQNQSAMCVARTQDAIQPSAYPLDARLQSVIQVRSGMNDQTRHPQSRAAVVLIAQCGATTLARLRIGRRSEP